MIIILKLNEYSFHFKILNKLFFVAFVLKIYFYQIKWNKLNKISIFVYLSSDLIC